MANEPSGQNPPHNPNQQPSTQDSGSPTIPVAPQDRVPPNPQAQNPTQNVGEPATARELHWLEKLNFAGQLSLVVVGIIAAYIYGRQLKVMQSQLDEMSKQTDLTRKQMIGTEGAILVFDPSIAYEAGLRSATVSFAVRAVPGRVAARNVAVDLTVQRISLPSKKPIGDPVRCTVQVPQIAGTDPMIMLLSGQARACDLPGLDQKAVDAIMFTRQSVSISGSFSYENGFGETFRQNVCSTYLAYKYSGFITPGRSISGQDSTFHNCADFDRVLARALAYKKRYKDDYVAGSFP